MKELSVGDEDCSFNDVVDIIYSSDISLEIEEKWVQLAKSLEESEEIVIQFRKNIRQGKIDAKHVIIELLIHWRSRLGRSAKLIKLIETFEGMPDCKPISDAIFHGFRSKILENTTWAELHPLLRSKMLEVKVEFLGSDSNLNEIGKNISKTSLDSILEKCRQEIRVWDVSKGVSLTRRTIPNDLSYYIPRRLLSKKCIDPKVFDSNSSDIFCFQGLSLNDLYKFAEKEPKDVSRNQVNGPTVRFIVLESEDDFEAICVNTSIPVHLIRSQDNDFYWVKSHGNIRLIQGYLANKQEYVMETEILKEKFSLAMEPHVCIIDTPGMGKTTLLANLARKVTLSHPSEVILYCRTADVFNSVNFDSSDISNDNIKKIIAIAEYVSNGNFGKEILLAMMNSDRSKIHLFLDGIDEIKQNVEVTMSILRELCNSKNIRLYVTSRPHLKADLENTLSVLSYGISAFDENEQINFLIDYWRQENEIECNQQVKSFAEDCIKTTKKSMSNSFRDMCGIPLHCAMLADIYSTDAENISKDHKFLFVIAANVCSIFQMYKVFIEKRFEKISPEQRGKIKKLHIKIGYQCLFGDTRIHHEIDFDLADEEVLLSEALSAGVLEKTDRVRFVHDSFAEYLLAEFVIDSLFGHAQNSDEYLEHWSKYLCTYFLNDIWKNYNFPVESQYLEVSVFLTIHPTIKEVYKNWEPLATSLGIPSKYFVAIRHNIAAEKSKGFLDEMTIVNELLTFWINTYADGALLGTLVNSLESNGFTDISGAMKERFSVNCYKNPSLWYFADAYLFELIDNPLQQSLSHHHTCQLNNSSDFYHVLTNLANSGYSTLPQLMAHLMKAIPEIKDSNNEKQWIALFTTAAENCNIELLKFLLKLRFDLGHSASPEMSEDLRVTLLKSACKSGNIQIAQYLLKYNKTFPKVSGLVHSVVNMSGKDSSLAVNNKREIINILKINDNECLNEKEGDLTPLHYRNVHFNLIKLLIEQGADPLVLNSSGGTFLHSDLHQFSPEEFHELVILLIKYNHSKIFEIKNSSGGSPVSFSLSRIEIQPKTLELLADSVNYDFNRFWLFGRSELHIAILFGRKLPLLETMVKLGALWTVRGIPDQFTVLHFAAHYGNVEALRYFLQVGADVNAVDKAKRTPLHLALTFGKKRVHDVVELLLEHGANCNTLDNHGDTSLHDVLFDRSNVAVVEQRTIDLLCKYGAKEYNNDNCCVI